MMKRSIGALKVVDKFYEDINTVNIYVEDTSTSSNKMYVEIFEKVFKGTDIVIKKVFPLGGRNEVQKKYEEDSERPSLFLIDGDLDIINERKIEIVDKKILFQLNRYCIENYLIEKDALLSFIEYEDSENSYEYIEERFNYEEWIVNNKCMLKLFTHYFICNKIFNVGMTFKNVHELKRNKGVDVCKNAVDVECENIRSIMLVRDSNYDVIFQEYYSKVESDSIVKYVSAKSYLMHTLAWRARLTTSLDFLGERSKIKLAKRCDFDSLKKDLLPIIRKAL